MRVQRLRPISRARAKPATSTRGSLDAWLVRLSHLSQFGLLLFTVGTIYFTVIPLYQKALLEESIAKKEIELKEATALLDAKEKMLSSAQEKLAKVDSDLVKTRNDLARAQLLTYVQQRNTDLFSMAMGAGADCTGLLRRPEELDDAKANRKAPFEENFELSPGDCIRDAFQKSRLRQRLKELDLRHIEKEIATLSTSLRARRNSALRTSNDVPEAARRNPKLLRPPSGFEARTEAFLARVRIINPLPPEQQREQDFQRAVTRTRNAISDEYLKAARDGIGDLGRTSWPIKVEP